MTRISMILPFVTSIVLVMACDNQTPQQKAEDRMQHAEEKAALASEDAMATAEDAAAKNTEAVVYANIAAANEAVANIPAPVLPNEEAKKLYKKLGRTIVDRINVKTAAEAMDKEHAITEIKNELLNKLQSGKITQEDVDQIRKYLADCLVAAQSTR